MYHIFGIHIQFSMRYNNQIYIFTPSLRSPCQHFGYLSFQRKFGMTFQKTLQSKKQLLYLLKSIFCLKYDKLSRQHCRLSFFLNFLVDFDKCSI